MEAQQSTDRTQIARLDPAQVRRRFNVSTWIACEEQELYGIVGHDPDCRCRSCRAYIQHLVCS